MKNTDELKQAKEELKIGFSWKPKKKIPTKPYQQLVSYFNRYHDKIIWGVYSHTDGNKVYAHWSNRYPCRKSDHAEYMELYKIIDVVDIIIHEPQEDKLTVAQELSVQQESANFGYQAVQGIISANEDKERLKKDDPIWEVPQKKGTFTFSDFDTSVKRTWKDQDFKDAVSNASLGLTGEAGEVADLIKKAIYHGRGFANDGHPSEKAIKFEDVKDELSDVLFYVSAMAQEFGFTLEEVARHNKEKLEKRYKEGFTVEESAQKKDKHIVFEGLKGAKQIRGLL